MQSRECFECKKLYEITSGPQKFCSKQCARLCNSRRLCTKCSLYGCKPDQAICKYCYNSAKRITHKKKPTRYNKCYVCDTIFELKPSSKAKYCGLQCKRYAVNSRARVQGSSMVLCSKCSTYGKSCRGGTVCDKCRNAQRKARGPTYRAAQKATILLQNRNYYNKHKDEIKLRKKSYRSPQETKKLRRVYHERYVSKPGVKEKILERSKEYTKRRYAIDPVYRMRVIVSSSVCGALKDKEIISETGKKTWASLPYTPTELKAHIESLFEPWMTWNNHGGYRVSTWDDDDQFTWTWQVDHIIPHSRFYYDSLDCEAFQQCWALSNLRPLSAKQNLIESDRDN